MWRKRTGGLRTNVHLRLRCSDAEPCRWCRWVLDEADGQPCDAHSGCPLSQAFTLADTSAMLFPGASAAAAPALECAAEVEAGREEGRAVAG